MSSKVSEVFELMQALSKMGTECVLETEKVSAENAPHSLLHPWEPDFVEGYNFKCGNHSISLSQLWDAYVAGENILLTGPSGAGKSTIAFHLLDKANEKVRAANRETYAQNQKNSESKPYLPLPYPLAHFSCTKQTRVEQLEGSLTFKMNDDGSREPLIVLGAVTDSWTNGKTLVLEEVDMPLPGVWAAAHQYFDGRTQETCVYINGPKTITKNKRFRVIATSNTLGRGENQTDFAGTEIQNTAFLNRFTYVVHVDYLPMDEELKLIRRRTDLRADVTTMMLSSAVQSRNAHKDNAVDMAITTRDVLSWARECKRNEKRLSTPVTDKSDYWREVVIPSAYPTFLNRVVDQNTREMFDTYLSIRA